MNMAEQKNNHFVPVFYLKLWSNNGKQINSYLINARRAIPATIRKETSKDYLYGKDRKIENVFAHLEDDVKVIIDKIITSQSILELNDTERMQLKGFMAVGAHRTQWQKEWYNLNTDILAKMLTNIALNQSKEELLPEKWEDNVKIQANFPYILKRNLPYLLMCIEDLSLALIHKSNESQEFIISDNPVVILNPLAEQWGFNGTGFACAGLIVYMPINPYYAILAYDSNAYEIRSELADYDDLNLIMVHNAVNNIYYKNMSISTIEGYLSKRKEINDNPESTVINGDIYMRIKKNPVPCEVGSLVKIKSKIDGSIYEKKELGAPNKYVYVRKKSDGVATIFEMYEKYLKMIKEHCEKNNIPIESVDTSFEAFSKFPEYIKR